jgi:isoleucyl-tRNA synthetase
MYDFTETEERILKFWDERGIFKKSVEARRGRKPFVFFEGPPTANAAPAIHHFIGRVFKDVFCRYQTMRGRFVIRKGGWDTHGLPVELQVEKALGFTNKKDIEAYGIAAFNAKCRQSVWEFKQEWDRFTRRSGYWLDLDDPYITYETPYVESLWAVIAQFNRRKLLYRAHRVVPYCTRCGTPLSSHEVNLGYKTVSDTAVTVKFKVTTGKFKGASILAWTTTPWTLPGNVALAVGDDIRYVLARKGEERFILAEELANKVLGAPLAIEAEFTGRALVGASYEPLFQVRALKKPKSYRVYGADFVTTTDGTGVVHTAVMYGEDDYRLGDKLGLVKHHTVTEQGRFQGVGAELDGLYVKSAKTEAAIISKLTTDNRLLASSPYEHEYPFCWRCETPLLYYAKDSWFVRTSAVNKQLLANNETINWVPAHLKHGRFGQWLREARDWAFSRERYWGTPLPVWMARDAKGKPMGTPLVVSSLADFEKYRARKPNRYWLVRHGEAPKNISGVISDSTQGNPLTALGQKQAMRAANALRKKFRGRKPALILASPILRTKETAHVIGEGLGMKVKYDERLEEIHLGPSLNGCHDAAYHRQYPTYGSKFSQKPPGGESLADLKTRVWGLLRELEAKYEGKNIVLVSHEYPIWMLADAAAGRTQLEGVAEKERRGDDFIGLAGIEELTVRSLPRNAEGEVDPHRPYIDDLVLKRGGRKLYRVPDLVDVWFDSGAMPFAQWHWPFAGSEKIFATQFPADFITEGIDQTRGWFYTLLAVSTLLGKGAPYRAALSYSHVLDEKGMKMSKSKGNVVKPTEVFEAVGADVARWYFYTINNPGDSKQFSLREVRERLTGFMMTLQNCVRFWELYKSDDEARTSTQGRKPTHLLDRWLYSRLHQLIAVMTGRMDAYDVTAAARALEAFVVEDMSQWWLRRSRKRADALGFLRLVLVEVSKLMAPFTPFAAEDIHQRLAAGASLKTESVHFYDWPSADTTAHDDVLEASMARVREFITEGLGIRKEESIRVRQPLALVTVPAEPLPVQLEELLREELNVKQVVYAAGEPVTLDLRITPDLMAEGWAREIVRALQEMRKEAGLRVGEKRAGRWSTGDVAIREAVLRHTGVIVSDASLTEFTLTPDQKTLAVERTFDLAPGRTIWIGLAK